MNEYGIIVRPEVLDEDFVPDALIARDKQIQELKFCLTPALRGRRPLNAWLYGRPGTGKTAVAKFVLEQLLEQTNVQGIYINCWRYRTLFAVLDKLVRDLRVMFADKPDATVKVEGLRKVLENKPFIVVLDEIDKPETKERNSILYELLQIGKVGLICICNSRYFLLSSDERVQSRLFPRQISFEPYTVDELVAILKQRAELALINGSWNVKTPETISKLAQGDARIAIQTLRNSAEIAESSRAEIISKEHILKAWNSIKDLRKKYLLEDLTWHHRALYNLIKERPGISSKHLWEAYLKVCNLEKKKPIATRTFSAYLARLKEIKLITSEGVEKRGRIFRIL